MSPQTRAVGEFPLPPILYAQDNNLFYFNFNFCRFSHNAGAIVGITIGLLIAVGFAGLWVFLALRRRKQQRRMELKGPPEHIAIAPEGTSASRPPLDDGDNDPVTVKRHLSARYTNLLAQLNAAGQVGVGVAGISSPGELLRDGSDEQGEVVSAQSHSSSQGHPPMPGFEQTADMLREEARLIVTMADSSAYMPRPRRESSNGPYPTIWFGGKELVTKDPSDSSSAHDSHDTTNANKRGSNGYDDERYAAFSLGLPTESSSQFLGSSPSEIGISNSKEPTPASYSFRNRTSSEPNSLGSILDRLRSGGCSSSSSPEPKSVPEVIVQDFTTPPPSTTWPTSHSLYINVGAARPPTPPSSLLRPISPNIPSQRLSLSTVYDGDRLWPTHGQLTLPPLPSPAVSEHSEDVITEGLLDPKLSRQLEQARFDSSVSLRDHEDYSRPIGGIVRFFSFHFDISLI